MFDHFCGKGKYETIFCGQGELFRVPQLAELTDNYLEIVRQAGQEFAENGISAEIRDKLKQPLLPREIFEKLADESWKK